MRYKTDFLEGGLSMPIESDHDYFCRRAEEELERAQAALDPAAVRIHYELANKYLNRAYREPAAQNEAAQT